MIKLELTPIQANIIYKGLKLIAAEIWDDPELAEINEDLCKSVEELDSKIMEYVENNINPIVDQINKQIK